MDLLTLRGLIKDYQDFPKKGIVFRDISPLIAHPAGFQFAIDKMASQAKQIQFNKILAIDARGFIFASALAYKTGKGLVMCRKPSKLPGELITENFGYEYDATSLSIQKSSIEKGDNVLIVDDVLATGNTTLAAYKAVEKLEAQVAGIVFFLELNYLNGRKLLEENISSGTKLVSILRIEE